MEAGRELDALIAEKVMGLDLGVLIEDVDYDDGPNRPNFYKRPISIPYYSTDIKAAWEIAEKFKREGPYKIEIHAYAKDDLWTIKAYHPEGYEKSCTTSSSSMAHAICLAALKVCGVEI